MEICDYANQVILEREAEFVTPKAAKTKGNRPSGPARHNSTMATNVPFLTQQAQRWH